MDFTLFESELQGGHPGFRMFSPSPNSLVTGRLLLLAKSIGIAKSAYKLRKKNTDWATVIGNELGTQILKRARRPIRSRITKLHRNAPHISKKDFSRKNGLGGRSWYNEPSRKDLVIVFHDANRAGPHLDVHIGRLSLIYRVKPELYNQLKYNPSTGQLTENSRKALIDHVKAEISNNSRVPQNLDHSKTGARSTWVNGDRQGKNYGDGFTRQIILDTKVDVIKAHADGPIELYAPDLNPHRGLYLYKIYPGDGKTAPICIFGQKANQPPRLEDRLHLKMIDPADETRILKNADLATSTAKYDGSAAYIIINKKGTYVYSPRESVKTGEQLEYTYMLDGIHATTSEQEIIAMGELLFKRDPVWYYRRSGLLLRSSQTQRNNQYLSSSVGSGILNSNALLPNGITPELRLYRIDKIGRQHTGNLPFWENRELQYKVASLAPKHLKVVELMTPEQAKKNNFEGFVAVPEGLSVNEGIKVKWWGDQDDMRIERIEFKPGERGGLAGVLWAEDLNTGKPYKFGPSQVGNRELTEHMMNHPDQYVGRVLKVDSRMGHTGRASVVAGFHDDK